MATVPSASERSRSTQTTLQPTSARRRAVARPLPMPSPAVPAPVIIATWPWSDREGLLDVDMIGEELDGMIVVLEEDVGSCAEG